MTFVVNTMLAINQSTQPLVGYYYGAEEYDNIPILRRYMLISVALLSILMVGLIEIFPGFFINVFLTDVTSEFMIFASRSLRIFAISFPILGFNITNGGYLTSVGKPRFDFVITMLRGYIFVAFLSYQATVFMDKEAIWYVLIVSDFLTMLISIFLSRKELSELKKLRKEKKEKQVL